MSQWNSSAAVRFPGMLPIRNISYLLPMCCSLWEKMQKQSKNWPGVQYPLKTSYPCFFQLSSILFFNRLVVFTFTTVLGSFIPYTTTLCEKNCFLRLSPLFNCFLKILNLWPLVPVFCDIKKRSSGFISTKPFLILNSSMRDWKSGDLQIPRHI